MALLYPEHALQTCTVNIRVRQKNGDPASFAVLDVFQVNKFLWWEYETFVPPKLVADYYGKLYPSLPKNRKYHFRFRWLGKEDNERIILSVCPWYMDVTMP